MRPTKVLVPQNFVAKQLQLPSKQARALVEAQGYPTFNRTKKGAAWAMATRDYNELATQLGLPTFEEVERESDQRAAMAMELADYLTMGRPRRGNRRWPNRHPSR